MISPDNVIIDTEIPDIYYGLKKVAEGHPDFSEYADDLTEDKVKEGLYQLEAICQNPYNSDYWRNLFALIALAATKGDYYD